MRKLFRKIASPIFFGPIFFGIVIWILPSCGTDLCVAGLGECSKTIGTHGDTTTPGEALTMTVPSTRVKVNAKLLFTAKGGVKPYTYFIVSGSGQINKDTGEYTAPADEGSAIIRVKDNSNKETKYDIAIVIEK